MTPLTTAKAWGDYRGDIPLTAVSIADAFQQAVQRYRKNIAVTNMGVDWSFQDIDEGSNHLAAFMQQEWGLRQGDRIAIMLPNVAQFPMVFLAAQKIGLICVNTNPLYTPREMKHQFNDSGCKAIVIMDLFADKLEKILKETSITHIMTTNVGDELPWWKGGVVKAALHLKKQIPKHGMNVVSYPSAVVRGRRLPWQAAKVGLDDVALLQYTGGTTGVSKGAVLSQKNILANMEQINIITSGVLTPGQEVVLTALPLYHIFALTVNLLAFMIQGHRSIFVTRPTPIENTVEAFRKYPITVMTGVNTLFNALNNSYRFREVPKHLRVAIAGGMALQDAVAKEWHKVTGNRVLQGYGLTEASPVTHMTPLDGGKPGSIGIPLPYTEAIVANGEGQEQAVGEAGELIIRGPQVMQGYWQRPDETQASLRQGWLWTGDIAKCEPDGFFSIVDRKKDMILVSGFNVFPNEVEEVISSHDKVLEVAVIGIPSRSSGESVKAFVVAKDKSLTEEELRRFCEENLTNYKRPRHFEFRDSLPKSNIGKILRKELKPDSSPAPVAAVHAGE